MELGNFGLGIRFQEATGARGIVQLGMAFGIDPRYQELGDVLVSSEMHAASCSTEALRRTAWCHDAAIGGRQGPYRYLGEATAQPAVVAASAIRSS